MPALDLELQRHLKEPRRPRVPGVVTMAEPGRASSVATQRSTISRAASLYDFAGAHQLEAGVEKPHARLDVAAVMRTEPQDARGHAVLERRPGVATLRAASVDGGVTPWSMDDTSIASSIRPIAGVGQLAHQQQVDRLAELRRPIISSSG